MRELLKNPRRNIETRTYQVMNSDIGKLLEDAFMWRLFKTNGRCAEDFCADKAQGSMRSGGGDQAPRRAPADIARTAAPSADRGLLTVAEAAALGPLTESALRHLIFRSAAAVRYPEAVPYSLSRFAKCVVRPSGFRRVFIEKNKYLDWLESEGSQLQ
ncbi:MAG: hypothetical protein J0L58_10655 [Burkholderiales bacterium]|nr:hypothetical protein [Burkholderiales bacterium]